MTYTPKIIGWGGEYIYIPHVVSDLEKDLAALMGKTIYCRSESDDEDDQIYVNAEGSVERGYLDYYGYFDNQIFSDFGFSLSYEKEKEQYVFDYKEEIIVTFFVDDDKITKIDVFDHDESYTYYPKFETQTAVSNIEANNTKKVVKTIENGRIVITKDGVKYDLSGTKLK